VSKVVRLETALDLDRYTATLQNKGTNDGTSGGHATKE
jgi:hypothetical protein